MISLDTLQAYAAIVATTHSGARVARVDQAFPEGIAVGTARRIVHRTGGAVTHLDPVEELHLEITWTQGHTTHQPLAELVAEYATGEFVVNYRTPVPA